MSALNIYKVKDRGKKTANFSVLRDCKYNGIPALLLECLFIDNKDDRKLLTNDKFINSLANEIAYGLVVALKIKQKDQLELCTIKIGQDIYPGKLLNGKAYFGDFISVREIFNKLGFDVAWDEKTFTVSVK